MSSKSRRTGSEFELRVLRWVREVAGLPAERLRLAGRNDEGDIAVQDVGLVYLIEAKAEQKIDLSGYIREAEVEAVNYAKARGLDPETVMPIVVVKRRNQPVEKSYVVTTLAQFLAPVPQSGEDRKR